MRTVSQFAICLAALAALAAAQMKPAPKPAPKPASAVTTAKKPVAHKPALRPVAAAKKPQPKPHPKPVMRPKKDVKAPVAAKVAANESKPSPVKAVEKTKLASRRDPFVNPITAQASRASSSSCGSGPRCLVISQIKLMGIVTTPSGPIAMVENESSRSYNLHEKDNLFNGSVSKITKDSVIFREIVTDALGHTSTREVVKKVTAPLV